MPIYTYRCEPCDQDTEQIRKIADRDRIMVCKNCRQPVNRKIDSPGSVWAPTATGGGMKV